MIKKIDIAGLQLDNYTVREMLMRVDRRISEKILTTIEEVNMDTLALAESDEEVKQALEACDYSVIADEGILRAVSADTLQRRRKLLMRLRNFCLDYLTEREYPARVFLMTHRDAAKILSMKLTSFHLM